MESLCERVEKKELHPHLYEAFPLERANEAMEVMREKKVFGKVILCMNGEEWCVCLPVNCMPPPKVRKAPEVIVFEDPDAKVKERSRVKQRDEDVCIWMENDGIGGKEKQKEENGEWFQREGPLR